MIVHLRQWVVLITLAAALTILIFGAGTFFENPKQAIQEEQAVCVQNGQRSIVVTHPSYFLRGGTGPKVLCVRD